MAKFHHIGLTVKDIHAALATYGKALGVDVGKIKVNPGKYETADGSGEEFLCAFFPIGPENYIEFVQPTTAGPTMSYLEKHGEGMSHMAFITDDIAGDGETVRSAGIPQVGANPGPDGEDVSIFFHPRYMNGVLLQVLKRGSYEF